MEKIRISSQDDFDRYIRSLKPTERCQYTAGIVVDLCMDERFSCPYRGNETYTLREGKRPECKRKRILELKKMLGH